MVVVVDYGLGNLRSVAGAIERLGIEPIVASNPEVVAEAARLVLPGVGAFGDGMRNLRERGLVAALEHAVYARGAPILGICLGAELMANDSDEFGRHRGLGWIDASVTRIAPADPSLRVPHVGWNVLRRTRDDQLFRDVPDGSRFYFVHSYHIVCRDRGTVSAETCYGGALVAAFSRGNIYGTQFHPEKSQLHGLQVLRNFLAADL
jgi:glutamine amidotransferase